MGTKETELKPLDKFAIPHLGSLANILEKSSRFPSIAVIPAKVSYKLTGYKVFYNTGISNPDSYIYLYSEGNYVGRYIFNDEEKPVSYAVKGGPFGGNSLTLELYTNKNRFDQILDILRNEAPLNVYLYSPDNQQSYVILETDQIEPVGEGE